MNDSVDSRETSERTAAIVVELVHRTTWGKPMSGRTVVTGERRSRRVGRALASVAVVVSVVVAGLTAGTSDSADAYSVGTAAWSNTVGFNTTATQTMPSGVVVSSQVSGAGVQNRGADAIGSRGGTAAMFTPAVATRPAIAVAPMGDGCTASAGGTVCANRGTWTVSFSQPVTNPVLHFEGFGANDNNNFSTILNLTSSAPAGATLTGPAAGATNLQVTGGNTIRTITAATNTGCTNSPAAGCGSVTVNGTVTTLTFRVDINAVGSGTNGSDSRETWNFAVTASEDFSDAPTTYNAAQAPVHIVGDLKLGATIDADNPTVANATASPFAVAAGADNNGANGDGADENAFTTLPTVPSTGTYALTVPLSGASKAGQVCGWVDFDKGGTFNTTTERACATFAAGATSANLSWTVPAGTTPGNTYARFRAAYGTVVGPTGREDSGEVEDYRVAIAPAADLAVTKTDGRTLYGAGTSTVYTVTVTNNGPSAVTGATVSDPLPSGITTSSWTCSTTAGGSCGASSGTGAISSTVNLPVNGVATYTITMPIPADRSGDLTNTFTATTPVGVVDPTPANNSATDIDQPQPLFACDGRMYLMQSPNGMTHSTLSALNTTANPFTYPALGQGSTTYNGIGYNPADNFLYGILTVAGSGDRLIRVGLDGSTVDLGAVSGLPTGFFDAGVIGTDGLLYVAQDAVTDAMYRINLTTRVATTVALSASTGDIRDLAWVGGTIYTVTSAGQLLSIDPTTGAVATIGAPSGAVLGYGALWGAPNGLFATENSGTGFYQFDLATGARTLISGSPQATLDDGANCPTANIIINTDLSVTKTDGKALYVPGTTNVYTVTVTNDGPFGIVNAPVSDPVPAGITTSSWTCSTTAGGSCGAASGTGAITSTVSLPLNGVATYTITMPIPLGRTGDLTNTFTANVPIGYTDPTPANNTASDTDTPVPMIDLQIEKIGESTGGAWVRMDGSSFAILADDNGQPGAPIALTIIDAETGLFQIDDMVEGTYWLSELTAPDGFSLLAEPVQFVISSAGVASITANGGGLVTAAGTLITVRDVPAMELPATGGSGSAPLVVVGVLLVLFAGVLALSQWRRNRRLSESPHDIDA
ncbi:UNVERIFIED_CONTAM: GEVED domain-containing protein [Microbacterium sp. SLM126]